MEREMCPLPIWGGVSGGDLPFPRPLSRNLFRFCSILEHFLHFKRFQSYIIVKNLVPVIFACKKITTESRGRPPPPPPSDIHEYVYSIVAQNS